MKHLSIASIRNRALVIIIGIFGLLVLVFGYILIVDTLPVKRDAVEEVFAQMIEDPYEVRQNGTSSATFTESCHGLSARIVGVADNAQMVFNDIGDKFRAAGWEVSDQYEYNRGAITQSDVKKDFVNPLNPDISGWLRIENNNTASNRVITVGFHENYKRCY